MIKKKLNTAYTLRTYIFTGFSTNIKYLDNQKIFGTFLP